MRTLLGAVLTNKDNKTPVPLGSRASGAFSGWRYNRGATQALTAMEAASVVFGIVDRLATSVSLVDWKLWRKAKSGKPEDREEVTSHLALDILNSPNEYFSRAEMMEAAQQHQELTGESWLVVSRDQRARSIPLELWTVRPDRMDPVPSAEKYLAGYEYRSPDGEIVPLAKDDVLFVRRPDPNNPYRGLGPIRSVLTDIDSIRYSMEWNKNFFMNSAEPGGIVEIDRRLSDDEFDELVSRWREQHQGVAQAHRVAILEQVKWVDRKYTMRDMQFTELRGVTEAGVKLAFGFPKFALGEVDDVNRAQGEASIAFYAKWLIVPRLERWKGVFNRRFLPMFGTSAAGLEFDYVSPVPEDSEEANAARTSKVTAAAQLIPLGFDPADTLKKFDLPDIKFNAPPAPMGMPGEVDPMTGEPVEPMPALPAARLDPFRTLAAKLLNAAPDPDPALARVQADWQQALSQLQADWRQQITPEQRAEIEQQVREAVDRGDLAALAAITVGTGAAAALLAAALIALAARSAKRMSSELAAQGAPPPVPVVPSDAALTDIAAATAASLGAGLAATAGAEALRRATPGVTGAAVAAAVGSYVAGLGDRSLTDQLAGALTRAQNEARLLTVEHVPQCIYIASEVNDANTCRRTSPTEVKRCAEIDGYEYPSWKAAWDDYAGGTYKHCKGRWRCRGTVVARWNPEAGL